MPKTHSFFITCAPFHEGLLLEELKSLGISTLKETHLGVSFSGTLKDAYRVLLWSRLAHHLLLKLAEFKATNQHALYNEMKKIKWADHINPQGTFRIDVLGKHNQFTHPHYLAQVAKDAIVDQLREQTGTRPNIEKDAPDVVLTIKAKNDDCQLYIDLSGESLHLRGYRHQAGPAPLKETLAAALVMRASWLKRINAPSSPPTADLLPQGEKGTNVFPSPLAGEGVAERRMRGKLILLDPMCGSGTILMEAAMMAFDIAPGLYRNYFGCLKWLQHDNNLWQQLISEAQARRTKGLQCQDIYLIGYDQHPAALIFATSAAKRLGIEDRIILEKRDLKNLSLPDTIPKTPGLIVTNPPYGVRLLNENPEEVRQIFQTLGERLKTPEFNNWELYLITSERKPVKALGIRMGKSYRFKNGDLECELLQFNITPERFWHADFNKN